MLEGLVLGLSLRTYVLGLKVPGLGLGLEGLTLTTSLADWSEIDR